jgi:hypothetical protein
MGRIEKLKRQIIAEANKRLLNETGPLKIDEGQNITLECTNVNNGSSISIDGRVDVNSRDVSTGYRDENGHYHDHEELVPQFLVVKERGLDGGVLAGQDQTFEINIQTIEDPELKTYIGEGVQLLYCDDAYCSDKYYCQVINVTPQFGDELQRNGVKI